MITKDHKNILLADDAAFFRNKLSAILTEVGHRVRSVVNGAEVIEELKARASETDLLVLDLQMPEIDGFGVIKWMRTNDLIGKVPVLIVTGAYDNKEVLKAVEPFSITEVMTKAFTPEQVVCRVNKILFESKVDIRNEERLPVSIPVDFVQGNEDNMQTGFILNIAAGGLFLHSRIELVQDSILKMRFSLPGVMNLIEALGVAQWGAGAAGTSGLFQGNGIIFRKISEGDKGLIKGFVKSKKRKGS